MQWSDVLREPSPRVVRQFAALCAVLLGALGIFQIFFRSRPILGGILMATGPALFLAAWLAPRRTRWLYTVAMGVAFPIGLVVSQLVLGLIFFVVFLAVGLILRARGWDPMLRQRRPPGATYWEPRSAPTDPRRYLRQY